MLPTKTSDCRFPAHLTVRLNIEARLHIEDNKWYIDLATLLVFKIDNRYITIDRVKNSVDTTVVLRGVLGGESIFWLINLILKFLPLSPARVFPITTPNEATTSLPPGVCWSLGWTCHAVFPGPNGLAPWLGSEAGRQDGRMAGTAREAQEGLSSRAVLTDPAAALEGSSGPIWRSVSPGFYSPTRIFTAHNHWLFLRTPLVCAGQPCVIHFLPSSPPATARPREPRSPQPGKEGSH